MRLCAVFLFALLAGRPAFCEDLFPARLEQAARQHPDAAFQVEGPWPEPFKAALQKVGFPKTPLSNNQAWKLLSSLKVPDRKSGTPPSGEQMPGRRFASNLASPESVSVPNFD